jgi:polyphenol oxidase
MTAAVPRDIFVDFTFSGGGLVAGYSTRTGGVSRPPYDTLNLGLHVGDAVENVIENRRRLADALGLEPSSFVFANQVHGDGVAVVTAADRGRGVFDHATAVLATDALVTADGGVVLCVTTADCVPVVLFDERTSAIGVAHAGWKGTIRHIAARTVAEMSAAFGTDPADVRAALGPSIGPKSYVIGPEVVAAANEAFPNATVIAITREGRTTFDLWRANRLNLVQVGVTADRIEAAGIDTYVATDRFFSARRHTPTGRFVGLIALR